MSAIITCNDVSIRYITGDFKDIGLKEYIIRRLTGNYSVTEFWADRHVSFELQPGDMLGIIGSNGAGKSTLLKAISGIMVPTEGWVQCNGKIAALLELASGFDGDLTVRENTYLRAAMLGYSRDFVDRTYDSIIDFAELRDFQERPFKQLSSGMKSRLAFSIASLVDPEILILDEVLSVGDGAFRKKSEAKMREIINGGATTILVSHSIGQVRSLCNKILWLDHGRQVAFGTNVKGLCDAYQKYLDTKKMPKPEELPPIDLPADEITARTVAKAKQVQTSTTNNGSFSSEQPSESNSEITAPKKRDRTFDIRHMPRAVIVTLIALALLTCVIAYDEARLPSKVRSLPQTATALYSNEQTLEERGKAIAPGVYLWDGKLYVFADRASAQANDAQFYLSATDGHGYVRTSVFDVPKQANKRFSTDDSLILVIPMGRYPGYVHLLFGELTPGISPDDVTEENAAETLAWGGTYDTTAATGRTVR